MSLLEWTDKLDVHVDSMNQEHVELIRLMNAVYDVNEREKTAVGGALDNLVRYVVKHFEDEEAYMESVGFKGLKSHQIIHKDLLDKVGKHVEDFKRSQSDALPDDFFAFLKFWLVSHIQGIDSKYGSIAA